MSFHTKPFDSATWNEEFRQRNSEISERSTETKRKRSTENLQPVCPYCNKTFNNHGELTFHMERLHQGLPMIIGSSLKCTICKRSFKNFEELKTHVEKHERSFECAFCGLKYVHQTLLKKHIERLHWKSDKQPTSECVERQKSHGENEVQCNFSNLLYAQNPQNSLDCEMRGEGSESKYYEKDENHTATDIEQKLECDICYLIFTTKESLETHKMSSHAIRFVCEICNEVFSLQCQLKLHKRITKHWKSDKQSEQKLECDICSQIFTTKESLETHKMSSHAKGFVCEICNEAFSLQCQLKLHRRITRHSKPDIKPKDQIIVECQICQRRFKELWTLRSHMVTHTSDKPFNCDECNQAFKTKEELRLHKSIHVDSTKNVECLYCKKPYKSVTNMIKHLEFKHPGLPNTTDPPLRCTVCKMKFENIDDLTKHAKTHPPKKPYKCHTCNKGFSSSFHTNRHVCDNEAINRWQLTFAQQHPYRARLLLRNL